MPQQIGGNQVRDESIKRDDIELNFNDSGALRAQDIPYGASTNVKDAIDNAGSGGATVVDVENFIPDDVNQVSNGTLWILVPCINFPGNTDGTVYFTFVTPAWDFNNDAVITIHYAMSSSIAAASLKLDLSYWVPASGSTLVATSPTETATQTFTPVATGNQYTVLSTSLAIAAAHLSQEKQMVVCKLTRDVSVAGNPGCDFQLIKLVLHQ